MVDDDGDDDDGQDVGNLWL